MNAAVIGFALIRSEGLYPSVSAIPSLSFTALSTLTSAILSWLAVISPTDLILLFPRWSISSTESLPFLISTNFFNTVTMSSFVRTYVLDLSSIFNLQFSFIRPTSDRSYLSSEKNRLLNKISVDSFVGGSPGLNIL